MKETKKINMTTIERSKLDGSHSVTETRAELQKHANQFRTIAKQRSVDVSKINLRDMTKIELIHFMQTNMEQVNNTSIVPNGDNTKQVIDNEEQKKIDEAHIAAKQLANKYEKELSQNLENLVINSTETKMLETEKVKPEEEKVIKEGDGFNKPIQTKKPQTQKKVSDDFFWKDPIKIWYMWPSLWNIKRKSRKIVKKIRQNPDWMDEQQRYDWLHKKVQKLIKITNVDIKVEGIENWLDRGVVLAVNHQSNFDPAIIFAINDFSIQQPVVFIAKKELWDDKTFGNFVRMIDCIPLDRQSPRSAVDAFRVAKDLIVDYKRSLVIFPEGTRSKTQNMNKFAPASMKIAQMAHAPIIPVTIINSYQILHKKREKRIEVKVVFGKPIMPNKHVALKTEDLTRNVQREVQQNMDIWKDREIKYELRKMNKKEIKEYKAEVEAKQKPKKKKKLKDLFKIVD